MWFLAHTAFFLLDGDFCGVAVGSPVFSFFFFFFFPPRPPFPFPAPAFPFPLFFLFPPTESSSSSSSSPSSSSSSSSSLSSSSLSFDSLPLDTSIDLYVGECGRGGERISKYSYHSVQL